MGVYAINYFNTGEERIMSLCEVVLVFAFFHTSEILAQQNTTDSRNHKLHYHFEALEFTSVTDAKSPVWDHDANILYWVDALNQTVHALNYTSKQHSYKHIGMGELNVVLPIAGSKRLLLGIQSFVYLFDWDEPCPFCLKYIAALDKGSPGNILNEGKADSRGRFWGGTRGPLHGSSILQDQGALYSLEQPKFEPTVQLKPVSATNGITWSLNNSILYFIDSETKKIDAFDFDAAKGRISNQGQSRNQENCGKIQIACISYNGIVVGGAKFRRINCDDVSTEYGKGGNRKGTTVRRAVHFTQTWYWRRARS
ncbi:regucalcin-like isoform X2 [Pieris napi]|uniref:regucalcin-like isoform X2 n=1 Tax=Pieris napi TaxID=78633 RepID=UPI001FBB7ADB|nr:regucalcin-like isoform X2 [Pieris napi]